MRVLDFLHDCRTQMELGASCLTPVQMAINDFFLSELQKLANNHTTSPLLNSTRTTVLFEGFYSYLPDDDFKRLMSEVRARRWEHHFGVPTITFLLSYKKQLEDIHTLFNAYADGELLQFYPWLVDPDNNYVIDHNNQVLVLPQSIFQVALPADLETLGVFTKTYNPLGGCTIPPCDPVSQLFITHAAEVAKAGGRVLEIGGAFGGASLSAIAKGGYVFCNDIYVNNLAVVHQRFLETMPQNDTDVVTGDASQLTLLPGSFPEDLGGLPASFFDAILICRVLHFFKGSKIEESLSLAAKLLKPGGKIYIVCETPFLKNWDLFIPELNKRIAQRVEWPGEITNTDEFDRSGRASASSRFIHWITKDVLERSLLRAGFTIEHAEYINREGQFPADLLRPEEGRESVVAIGVLTPIK